MFSLYVMLCYYQVQMITSSEKHSALLESLPVSCSETECHQLCSLAQHPIYGKGDCEVSCQLDFNNGFNCSSICNCPMAMASEQLHKVKKRSAQQLAYNGWFPAGYQPYAAPHTLDEYDDLSYDFDSALEIDDENPDYEDINLRSIRHVEEDVGTFDMTPADKEFLKSLYDDYGEDTGDYYDYPDTFVPVAIPPPYILLQPQVVQPVYQQQKPAYQHHQIQPEERVLYPPHQPKSANLHHSTVPPQSSIRPSTPRAIRDDQMVVKISRKRHERPVDCDSLKCANLCQQFNYKLGICEVDFDRVLNYPAKCVCSEKAELEEKFKRELAGFREDSTSFDCQNCTGSCINLQSQLPNGFCLQTCNFWPGRGCEGRCRCPVGSDWLESPPVVNSILPCNIDRCKQFCLAMGKHSEGCVMYRLTSKELSAQCRCV